MHWYRHVYDNGPPVQIVRIVPFVINGYHDPLNEVQIKVGIQLAVAYASNTKAKKTLGYC